MNLLGGCFHVEQTRHRDGRAALVKVVILPSTSGMKLPQPMHAGSRKT
jgi:hypothetical protein